MTVQLSLMASLIALSSLTSLAQEAIMPRPSPVAIVSCRYKDSYFKITYSQPHKRGREIFGKLIPFGQVWRLGANEATELTITKDILVNNQTLKAGTYSLFAIPNTDYWTIIINSDVGLWGSYNYSSKLDVLRLDVPVVKLEGLVYEPFTILIDQKSDKAEIGFMWDKTKVSLNVQFIEPKINP